MGDCDLRISLGFPPSSSGFLLPFGFRLSEHSVNELVAERLSPYAKRVTEGFERAREYQDAQRWRVGRGLQMRAGENNISPFSTL